MSSKRINLEICLIIPFMYFLTMPFGIKAGVVCSINEARNYQRDGAYERAYECLHYLYYRLEGEKRGEMLLLLGDITYKLISSGTGEVLEEGINAYREWLMKYRDTNLAPRALYQYGRLLQAKGAFFEADLAYSELIDEYPDNVLVNQAYFQRGEIARILGEDSASLNYYQKSISGVTSGEFLSKVYILMEECSYRLDDLDKAEEYLGELNRLNPDSLNGDEAVIFKMAEVKFGKGKYHEAYEFFSRYLKLFPNGSRIEKVLERITECLDLLEDKEVAVNFFNEFLNNITDPEIKALGVAYLANILDANPDLQTMVPDLSLDPEITFKSICKQYPSSKAADKTLFFLYEKYSRENKHGKALECIDKIVERNQGKNNEDYYSLLGRTFFQWVMNNQGRNSCYEIINQYEKFKMYLYSGEKEKNMSLIQVAKCYYSVGIPGIAIDMLEDILAIGPSKEVHMEIAALLVKMYFDLKKWENVEEGIRFLMEEYNDVDTGEYQYILGKTLYLQGKYTEAANVFYRIIDLPGEKELGMESMYYLARCLMLQEEWKIAESYYLDFVNNFSKDKLSNEKMKQLYLSANYGLAELEFLLGNYHLAFRLYSSIFNKLEIEDNPWAYSQLQLCKVQVGADNDHSGAMDRIPWINNLLPIERKWYETMYSTMTMEKYYSTKYVERMSK